MTTSEQTYEAGPGFFLPVGTSAVVAARLADEAGVRLWWHKRQSFIDSGYDWQKFFGCDAEDVPPEALDEDGIPIPTIYTGILINQITVAATPKPAKIDDPATFKPTYNQPLPHTQCVQIRSNGERCERQAILGGTHCPKHGGRNKVVQAKAAERLEAARARLIGGVDSAIDVLFELSRSPETADATRLKASTEILDRAGLKGGTDIKIEVEHTVSAAEAIQERFAEIRKRQQAARQQEIEANIIEIEVIEEK